MFFVYLLVSTNGATYVGATVNLNKRLRQHNGELVGGAKATTRKVEHGESWLRAAYVSGFPDWSSALQFEWRWKQISRKLSFNLLPLERRIIALKKLLELDRPTSKAKLYTEWETPPETHFEMEEAKEFFTPLDN